jgi:hypothetical protein
MEVAAVEGIDQLCRYANVAAGVRPAASGVRWVESRRVRGHDVESRFAQSVEIVLE